jgi:predicted site-specific integrase-resolvase
MKYLPSRKASEMLGVHPNTLRNWANSGKIEQITTPSGQRKYNVQSLIGTVPPLVKICYCRVNSPSLRDELEKQVELMQSQYPNYKIIKDIGSGLHFKRQGLRVVLEHILAGDKLEIVVIHKDHLAQVGFELIQYLVEQSGGQIVVLNQTIDSPASELKQDLLAILQAFSCQSHNKNEQTQALSQQNTQETTDAIIKCVKACLQQENKISK